MALVNYNKCPCCKSQNGNFLYELDYGGVYKCADCEMAYTVFKNLGPREANEAFNKTNYIKTRLYDQYELRKIARKRLDLLGKFINGGNILEFGSSTGEFLYEAAKKGYKVSSVDLHPVVLAINKTDKLLEIVKSDAASFIAEEIYDAIAAFHVIEHLMGPGEFLRNCRRALKPRGILFLEVPNFYSLARRVLGKRSGMFYDYHVCHFGRGSLGALVKKYGYEVLAMRTIDDPARYIAPIYNPFRHGLWGLIKKLIRRKKSGPAVTNVSGNMFNGYSAADEIKILNSNKARFYRLEAGLIRFISGALSPVCWIFNNCYLGCHL